MLSTFGTKLRETREQMGLTGYRLSQLSLIPRNHIAVLESGKRAATPAVIAKLAPHLGVSVDEMQSWADEDALGPTRLDALVEAHADRAPIFYLAYEPNPPRRLLWIDHPEHGKTLAVFPDKDAVYRSDLVDSFLEAVPVRRRDLPAFVSEWRSAGFESIAFLGGEPIMFLPLDQGVQAWGLREAEPGSP